MSTTSEGNTRKEGTTPREKIEQFLEDTDEARRLSQRCRDYRDNKQWTSDQISKLESRNQAPIVVNRIGPKVEGLVGMYELRKSDPKAYPRTQREEKSANVVTDALRFVADNSNFDMTRLDVAEDFFVEGYGGVFIDVRRKRNQLEIMPNRIPWDRIYYQSHSRRYDFKDANWMGIFLWMDRSQARQTFKLSKKKADSLEDHNEALDAELTTEDRPRWTRSGGHGREDRVRIAMHFELVKDVWRMIIFSGDTIVRKWEDSPFKDEDGFPMNPIELVSGHVDRNNNRYSEASNFLSQQDEVNHRRSKFLHLNSTRQTFGNAGAVPDPDALKRELAKPDGHYEAEGKAEFGKDFGVLPTGDMSQAQFNLYLDAKAELDRSSFNAPLSGDTGDRDLSGVAINRLQQAGALELNRQYALLRNWEKRVHEQVWARVKQFWNEEKWIRVTDDQDALRWVGLNSQVTAEQLLTEKSQDKSIPLEQRQETATVLQFLQQTQNPRLNEIVETSNEVAKIDIDIIIDQSFDVVNIQQEQFEMISQFAGSGEVDILELIELSQLRGKEELISKIERRRAAAAQDPMRQIEQQTEQAKGQQVVAKTENISADTVNKRVGAVTQQLENLNLVNNPDSEVQVSV